MPSPVLDSIDDVVLVIDSKIRTIGFVNPAVEVVFGYRQDEILGKETQFLHVSEEEYARFSREFDPLLEQNGTFRTEYYLKRKDGSAFPAQQWYIRDAVSLECPVVLPVIQNQSVPVIEHDQIGLDGVVSVELIGDPFQIYLCTIRLGKQQGRVFRQHLNLHPGQGATVI